LLARWSCPFSWFNRSRSTRFEKKKKVIIRKSKKNMKKIVIYLVKDQSIKKKN